MSQGAAGRPGNGHQPLQGVGASDDTATDEETSGRSRAGERNVDCPWLSRGWLTNNLPPISSWEWVVASTPAGAGGRAHHHSDPVLNGRQSAQNAALGTVTPEYRLTRRSRSQPVTSGAVLGCPQPTFTGSATPGKNTLRARTAGAHTAVCGGPSPAPLTLAKRSREADPSPDS